MNYYDELIKKIESYIENNQFNQAINEIDEELKMPYVPLDIETRLKEYLKMIKVPESRQKSFSDDDIIEYLKGDEEKQLIAVDCLSKKNLRDYIDICEDYLNNTNIYKNAKALLIDSLINQEINHNFSCINDCSLLKFNPSKLEKLENTRDFKETNEKLFDYYLKDPSKYKLAQELLYKEALLSLPNVIDGNMVFSKIIKYIDDAFTN